MAVKANESHVCKQVTRSASALNAVYLLLDKLIPVYAVTFIWLAECGVLLSYHSIRGEDG